MKSYLFAFGDKLGSQEQVEDILDNVEIVDDWRSDFPNVYYIRSDAQAEDLAIHVKRLAEKRVGKRAAKARYIIVEITENSNGYLDGDCWQFIAGRGNPKPPSELIVA